LQFAHRVGYVGSAHDGVTLKDASRFPSADCHNYAFRNSGTTKIPRSRPPQIMEDHPPVSVALGFATITSHGGPSRKPWNPRLKGVGAELYDHPQGCDPVDESD
jgi:hypothetical protein